MTGKPKEDDYRHPSHDAVRHPAHYDIPGAGMEVEQSIDVIFSLGWGEGFCKGNALKYLTREGNKEGEEDIKDAKKARTYVDFWINFLETGHPRRLGATDKE